MHWFLTLCILALSIHSVVLEYNCVRIANVADVSIEVDVWDTNRNNTENITIASGSYHAFATQSGVFGGIALTKDGSDLVGIGFSNIFTEHEDECQSRTAVAPTVPGVCHKPPCCKTTLSIGLDDDGQWNIVGKTVNSTANPHIVWTCNVSKSTSAPLMAYIPDSQTTENDIAGCDVYFFNDTTDTWQVLTNQDQILSPGSLSGNGIQYNNIEDDVEITYYETDEFPLTVIFTDGENIRWKVEMRSSDAALTMCVPKTGSLRFYGDETREIDLGGGTQFICLKFWYDPEWWWWHHDIEVEAWGYTDPDHVVAWGDKWGDALGMVSSGMSIVASLFTVGALLG